MARRRLLTHLRSATRAYARTPALTLTILITLTLGLAAGLASFTLADALVLRPLAGIVEADRLVRVAADDGEELHPLAPTTVEALRRMPAFSGLCAATTSGAVVTVGDRVAQEGLLQLAGDCFDLLGTRAQAGRLLTDADDRARTPVAVLTHESWQRLFAGAPDTLGRTLTIGAQPFTIVGITAPGFRGISNAYSQSVVIPVSLARRAWADFHWTEAIARLAPGVTVAQARAQVEAVWPRLLAEATLPRTMSAEGRRQFEARRAFVGEMPGGFENARRPRFRQPLLITFGLSVLMLAICAANVASLMTARALSRRREEAIRTALGATTSDLVSQRLIDALLPASIAALLALPLAQAIDASLLRLLQASYRGLDLDLASAWGWRSAAFLVVTVVALTMVGMIAQRIGGRAVAATSATCAAEWRTRVAQAMRGSAAGGRWPRPAEAPHPLPPLPRERGKIAQRIGGRATRSMVASRTAWAKWVTQVARVMRGGAARGRWPRPAEFPQHAQVAHRGPTLAEVLRDGARTTSGGALRGRRWLVGAQVALTVLLVCGAARFVGTLMQHYAIAPGFAVENSLVVSMTPLPGMPREAWTSAAAEAAAHASLLARIEALPGVRAASLSAWIPLGASPSVTPIERLPGRPGEEAPAMLWSVSERFFDALGIPIIAGRPFAPVAPDGDGASSRGDVALSKSSRSSRSSNSGGASTASNGSVLSGSDSGGSAIINASLAARLFPAGDAVGSRLKIGLDPRLQDLLIVGIAADAHVGRPQDPRRHIVYLHYAEGTLDQRGPYLIVRGADEHPERLTAAVTAAIRAEGRALPLFSRTLAAQWALALGRERLLAGASGAFGLIGLVMAAAGLFGLLTHVVTTRRAEIGIRLAIGADARAIARLLLTDVAALLAIGGAAGALMLYAASRAFDSLLSGVAPHPWPSGPWLSGPWLLGATLGLIALVALAAIWLPLRRARAIDPAIALRGD